MKWMEAAWSEVGVREVSGAAAHPEIVAYFRAVGRGEVTSDETPWCAAFVGACIARAGIDNAIPAGELLLARSYEKFGTSIDEPRTGAIAVLSRGDPNGWSGHVGFVVGETTDTIMVLGGNQANSVNVSHYSKSRVLSYRWPEPEKKPSDLAAAGSRTVKTAKRARNDSLKATVAVGASAPATAPFLKDLSGLSRQAGELKTVLTGLVDFGAFLVGNVTAVAGTFALYWLLRIAWAQGWIAWFRTEDHNSGAHTGREVSS